MISLTSSSLKNYLETAYGFRLVGIVDIDWLICQPRKTLYEKFVEWHKSVFDQNERIVLYSRQVIDFDILVHIQKCASMVDISNFFILLCSPFIEPTVLEKIRIQYSSDEFVFSTLELTVTDAYTNGTPNNLITLPETFCFAPWANLEISSQGQYRPCCVFKDVIRDPDGRPFHIQTDDIQTVYTSQFMADLRQQFVSGQKPKECSNCWYKEQQSGESNRQWFTTMLGSSAQTLTIEQESTTNLISFDIKLGNQCNFACRICSPISSSKIAQEYLRYGDTTYDWPAVNKQGRWTDNSKIWSNLKVFGSQLVNIDFFGGEPFLIKQQENFLDFMIEHQWASNIKLHYNTNGSIFPSHLFKKWKYFRQIDIAFSIDDIGSRFELTRGGEWNTVDQNIDRFFELKMPNMILNVFPTVSVQNIFYLKDLIDWIETKKFNAVNFNLLESPSYLSITKMGNELSNIAISKLNQIESKKQSKYNIKRFISLIMQNINSQDHIDQLAIYMLNLDTIRNQNLYQTHPDLAKIIYKGK